MANFKGVNAYTHTGTVNIFSEYDCFARGQMGRKGIGSQGPQKHLKEYPSIDSKQRTLSDFIN